MKTTKFFALALAALALVACEQKNNTPTLEKIEVTPSTLTLEVGETANLQTVLTPAGTEATITWESQNPAVASVAEGTVVAISEGTSMILAKAEGKIGTCLVTVTAKGQGGNDDTGGTGARVPQGSEFYPIIMDGTTSDALGDKIIADFRPDDTTKWLYIWENTYMGNSQTSGLNFFGNADGYTSLTCIAGWSGAGFNVPTTDVNTLVEKIMAAPDDYYFHMAIKSADQYAHCFYIFGLESTKFVLGPTSVYDGPVEGNFLRDGSWFEYEFPMSKYATELAGYNPAAVDVNLFVMLTQGVAGAVLNLDAVYIYKK